MSALPNSAGIAEVAARSRALTVAERRQREKAPRRHGLYAKSSSEAQQRQYKAGRMLRRLQVLMADQGTPILEQMVPAARALSGLWVVGEQVLADILASLRRGETLSPRLLEAWASLNRTALLYEKEFGLTPRSSAELGELGLTAYDKKQRLRRQEQLEALEASRRLRARQRPLRAKGSKR